jgi:hypothetical protein
MLVPGYFGVLRYFGLAGLLAVGSVSGGEDSGELKKLMMLLRFKLMM